MEGRRRVNVEGSTDKHDQQAALQETRGLSLRSVGQCAWDILVLQRSNKKLSHIVRQIFLLCKASK